MTAVHAGPESPYKIFAVDLPDQVECFWDLQKATSESTRTKERICINGLWRWQPVVLATNLPPEDGWGYFKVPGPWPGITDYMQKDSQSVYPHPDWSSFDLRKITSAWYEREISVPDDWGQRRISLQLNTLNSFAGLYVDGIEAGEIRFPGGKMDLTPFLRPGESHRLSLLVAALPLKEAMVSNTDSASEKIIEGSVKRRGLCGDVYLVSEPRGPSVERIQLIPSIRRSSLVVQASMRDLDLNRGYRLRGSIRRNGQSVHDFESIRFEASDLDVGIFRFEEDWIPEALWDLHTPSNLFEFRCSLLDAEGEVLDDHWSQRFGFREFWIDGKDFYLNGTRLFLSSVPLDNAQVGASHATYEAARETMERLKGIGINYVYTHHYGCEPGAHLDLEEILRAADDVGMLIGLSQPHFSHYDWPSDKKQEAEGYRTHARHYVEVAGNHPSVVLYVTSHNATGYAEDMNPDWTDGIRHGRDAWAQMNADKAVRAEAILRDLDSSRPVYHHASGNLGVIHSSNFYPNFVPVQELDDWFEHWSVEGVKPAFTCEYGAPFTWDWTMYRGWYLGQREWGSARVPWEFSLAEWNAQFFGDAAYQITEQEKTNLRWEARQFREGKVWHRWDYPHAVGSDVFEERYPVFADYITHNWRAFRTWGLSGISPWEYGHFWKLKKGFVPQKITYTTDWEHLQRPGFSPDTLEQHYQRMDTAFEVGDWEATDAAKALLRNNGPLLMYIAGKPGAFTSKDAHFHSGEQVEKQILVINNSRQRIRCKIEWSVNLQEGVQGGFEIELETGDQVRVPISFTLSEDAREGEYKIEARAVFDNGEFQYDAFDFICLGKPKNWDAPDLGRVAVYDPLGETMDLLDRLGIKFTRIDGHAVPSDCEVLVIGKQALVMDQPGLDLSAVKDGMKVLVFEQTSEVLEKRFGFRVQEYGLRNVFPAVKNHPILNGIRKPFLQDWRGSATLTPPRLNYQMRPQHGPTIEWCGIPVTRPWRCGNRGNVVSVLIEKPVRGDFLPIMDGGYSLQYSPLLEYREGEGLVMMCQLDVTGRTEPDPVADLLVRNLFDYLDGWRPGSKREIVYVGDEDGKEFLEAMGIHPSSIENHPSANPLLVIGHSSTPVDSKVIDTIHGWMEEQTQVLALGLDHKEIETVFSSAVPAQYGEHLSAYLEPFPTDSPFAGIRPSNLHLRNPRKLTLIQAGPGNRTYGGGVLSENKDGKWIMSQLTPWLVQENPSLNLRRDFRQTAFLLNRLLSNLGVEGDNPFLERFNQPVEQEDERRWLKSFYLDEPIEWDDPYRFFRW